MRYIGTILHGWGCKVLYLLDNDQGKKDGKKNLKKKGHVPENFIFSITGNEGDAIEDVFSKTDFKRYVLQNEEIKYSQSNSQYLKENKKDKVLLSKQFLESSENIEKNKLDKSTYEKIEDLFKKIEAAFS